MVFGFHFTISLIGGGLSFSLITLGLGLLFFTVSSFHKILVLYLSNEWYSGFSVKTEVTATIVITIPQTTSQILVLGMFLSFFSFSIIDSDLLLKSDL